MGVFAEGGKRGASCNFKSGNFWRVRNLDQVFGWRKYGGLSISGGKGVVVLFLSLFVDVLYYMYKIFRTIILRMNCKSLYSV